MSVKGSLVGSTRDNAGGADGGIGRPGDGGLGRFPLSLSAPAPSAWGEPGLASANMDTALRSIVKSSERY